MYLALDLELNNAPGGATPNPKIIQVGVAVGEPWSIVTRSWYVDPQEPIWPGITKLTGITDHNVQHESVGLDIVAQELGNLIDTYKPFVNPVTWGGGDMPQLLGAFAALGCRFPYFGRRWIDTKTWYTMHMLSRYKKPNGGLSSAMAEFGLRFEGTPHRADTDAKNTLELFYKMLEYQRKRNDVIKMAKEM